MRQTSRAVALLLALEGAQATAIARGTTLQDYAAAWNPNYTGADIGSGTELNANMATAVNRLQSRTAPYAAVLPSTSWSWATPGVQHAKICATCTSLTDAANTISDPALASGCVACIGGGAVWCSRTFSYLITTATTPLYQYEQTAGNHGMNSDVPTTDANAEAGTYDGGSCCQTKAAFLALMGKQGTPAAGGTDWTGAAGSASAGDSEYAGVANTTPAGAPGNALTCVAVAQTTGSSTATENLVIAATGNANAFGLAKWATSTVAYDSWWCSNGLYTTVTVATSATSANTTQGWLQASNQRLELALVGCPQKAANCGVTTSIATSITGTTAVSINVPSTLTTMNFNEKCTWVAYSYSYAPTFALAGGISTTTTTDNKGLVGASWELHAMEYTTTGAAYASSTGSLQENAGTGGAQAAGTALSLGTFLPQVTMPAVQFATLRTWYGSGGATVGGALAGMQANWYAPGQNTFANTATDAALVAEVAGQQWGNVSNFPSSSHYSGTTALAAGSGATYGAIGSSSTKFDMRVVRYLPASAAVTVWDAGSALLAQYNSAKTAYDAAKTTWDAYVAILTKNAKMDAFAAAFSPPKAPTVPPLPNLPWVPATYSGYVKQTAAEYATMTTNSAADPLVEGAQPTAQQFWTSLDAAQTIGGWGSWTAHIFTYRNGFGKSFGTLGYSGATGTAAHAGLSAVWRYQWTCRSGGPTQSATAVCDQSYSAAAGALPSAATASATADNAASGGARLVSVVSLWSRGNAGTAATSAVNWSGQQSLALTWTGAAWSTALVGLTQLAAPAAATAASSLSGIAGAQALAASTAAALAAAALY